MSTNDNSSLDDIQNLEIDFLFSIFDNHNNKQNHSQLQYDKVTHSGSFTFHPKFIQPIKVYGPLTNIKLRNNCIANTSMINTSSNKCYYHLQYLPVIIMSFILPSNYPGNIPNVTIPQFNLSSIWLPLSILNKIEQKLIEIANYHLGETTLWSCIEFLQNEHFYYMLEEFTGNLTSLSFDLFKFYAEYTLELDLSIEDFCNLLLINNDDRIDIEFDESFIECNVCYEVKKGKMFIRFTKCQCFICFDCTIESFKLSINESLFNGPLSCLQCGEEVNQTEVRYILPEDLYNKYEYLVLKRGLDIMPDIVNCPRANCETPVILDSENLARCPQCKLSFCPICLQMYHGVEPCLTKLQTSGNLSQADNELILRRLNEEEESEKLIIENYKLCPGCWTPCEKVTGCNKMTCSYCHLFFCWLCLEPISNRQDPYSHFTNGTCYGQLWTENKTE